MGITRTVGSTIRTAAATAGLAATALAGALALPAAASAADTGPGGGTWKMVGKPNLSAACANQYPGQARVLVLLNSHDALTWKCRQIVRDSAGVVQSINYGPISVDAQCKVQYGSAAKSVLLNRADPYSWTCQRWVNY